MRIVGNTENGCERLDNYDEEIGRVWKGKHWRKFTINVSKGSHGCECASLQWKKYNVFFPCKDKKGTNEKLKIKFFSN